MPMKNPPHPGKFILEECLEPLGLSITKALGITPTSLSRLIDGHTGEMAACLSRVFGGSAESWLRQQMNYDLAQQETHNTGSSAPETMPR